MTDREESLMALLDALYLPRNRAERRRKEKRRERYREPIRIILSRYPDAPDELILQMLAKLR